MARLIIAEKPSVARDIARVLKIKSRSEGHFRGNKVWISWCIGHVAELCEPAEYDKGWKRWAANTLPMMPEQFKVRASKHSASHFKILKKLMRDREVEEVINACDAGREGELIFRYAYELAGCKRPVRRLWLSSMTDQAIQQALRNLRPGADFDNLGDAARCRSEADWLVGLNATRALTIQGRRAGHSELLSVGRVQTPTLAMIVHREEEIEAFVPEPFWQIYAHFKVEEGKYEGMWIKAGGRDKDNRFDKKEAAEAVAKAVDGQSGLVDKIQQKKIKERPPLLHDLTQLQRAANQRYNLSAAVTLAATQALYEKHKLVTYPRTDSNFLTTDMIPTLPGRLKGIATGPWQTFCDTLLANPPLPTNKRIVNNKEVGDHHAIIPTGRKPNPDKLTDTERKIFDLIARRFIAVFYPDAIFATTRIETLVAEHRFLTRGRVRLEPGWQAVDPPLRSKTPPKGKKPAAKGKPDQPDLPNVSKGDAAEVTRVRVHEGSTKPPKRHNESSLLGAMERAGQKLEEAELRRAMKESGLGTPATRASIIETLLKRSFIERKGKNLVPTPRGRTLIHALPSEDLKSAQLTGAWEARLTRVAEGKLTRPQFMKEVRDLTARLIPNILSTTPAPPSGDQNTQTTLGKCPICGTPVTEGFKAYSCRKGRDCTFVIFKSISKRKISPQLVQVLLHKGRSQPLKGFRSKAGKPFTAALVLNDEGQANFEFNQPRSQNQAPPEDVPHPATSAKAPTQPQGEPPQAKDDTPSTTCPSCKEGHVIRGKRGWGCSRWRQGCRFVVWFEQKGLTIPQDEAERLFNKGRTRMMNGFVTDEGKKVRGRLALDLATEGHVRLELSQAKSRKQANQPAAG